MSSFESSILRVLNGDSVVGAAFLVSDRLVVTCAHVVESAGAEVDGKVSLRLPDDQQIVATVVPEYWRDPNSEDIAILRLENPVDDIEPLVLGSSSGAKGHTFSTFGFPRTGEDLAGSGEIIGQAMINGIKVLQLRSPEVTPGFSGAPVFNEKTKRVVGMVVAIKPPDEYQRLGTTAFAITSEMIREKCSELQISNICPYRSLDAFMEEDAPFFFGRERVVKKMIESLKREPRFLAVLGPSGSGKSSVVRAGLIPALKEGKVTNSEKWGVIIVRPSAQPFEQLVGAGLPETQEGIESAVRLWLVSHPEKTRLVLVIDQFEELLVSTPENIREKFILEISQLLDTSSLITIILTLRSDFYGRFQQDVSTLLNWLERGLVNIPPTLDNDEIREIVMEPARSIGLSFEEGLVNVILSAATEVGLIRGIASSSILPLLEFTLSQLWEKKEDGLLTHNAYYSIGGVAGGLSQWADRAYSDLNEEERKIARRILIDLVNFGNEAQGIPDTKRLGMYDQIIRHEKELIVVQKLIQARLLMSSFDYSLKQDRLEIIHEALLYQWIQLSNWIQEDRKYVPVLRQFSEDAKEWEQSGRDTGLLYQGARLRKLKHWLESQKIETLSMLETDFLGESIKQDKLTENIPRNFMIISPKLDIESTLNNTLALLNEVIGSEQSTIMILGADGDLLHYRAGCGYLTDRLVEKEISLKLKIGDRLAGWVVKNRKTALVNDLLEDPYWIKSDTFPSEHRSSIAVPLLVGDITIGVLMVFHRQVGYFGPEHVGIVEATASQIGIAINNVNQYELIRDQAERLGTMLRKEQEEASRSQAILEAVADGVVVTGPDNRITFLNTSAVAILGLEADKLINQSLDVFGGIFGKAAGTMMQTINDWSNDPASYQYGESYAEQLELEDGHITLVHLAPVIMQNEFLGTISIFRDISHEVEVDRLKSEFVATVSHELRTPMTSARGYVDILLMGAAGSLNENQAHFLSIIKNNMERLNILINDLLDVTRIEAGRVTLSFQLIELREVGEAVVADMMRRSQEENKPMKLSLNVTQNLPKVYADFERVRQILGNLIDNAYQYTPENGIINIRIHPSDVNHEIQIDIEDNGIGVPLEDQDRIFDRFYRGEDPLVLATPGTGLGLSIVKQLVEMQNGRIWLQSSGVPGKGSIFSFTLPMDKST